jgi:asparagine synthetase B (glutamine-hydrolysing)
MFVMIGWFATHVPDPAFVSAAQARTEQAAAEVVPSAYRRHTIGGQHWGLTVLHGTDPGALTWPVLATDGPTTAISLGLPLGLDIDAGPIGLARRLLAGDDLHRDVVPPFGLLAVDADRRVVVQQDWLGMCRLFTGTADGITVVASRPSLVAAFLHGRPEPDLAGWGSYLVTGHFGGDMSPVAGVRLMSPGERMSAERRGGGWQVGWQARTGVDDIVMSGRAGADRLDDALDEAAHALANTAAGLARVYSGPVELGLSGGKDSRLIAAATLAAGLRPHLVTNIEIAAEGETAAELVAIARTTQGLELSHQLRRVSDPAQVLDVGLAERIDRLHRRFDFQYPSTFSVRPAVSPWLDNSPSVRLSGVGGELVTGYWYPSDGSPPQQAAARQLMKAIPAAAVRADVHTSEAERIAALLSGIAGAGLADEHLIDYLYLVERARRWYSSAYSFVTVTPFLAPGFVRASFACDPQHKRDRAVHAALLRRLLPQWADVPFVSGARTSTATRIWQGDGLRTIADLLDTCHGRLPELFRRQMVERALRDAAGGLLGDSQVLRQFAWAARASHRLEPGTITAPTSTTYRRITAVPRPPRPRWMTLARRVAHATPWGRRAWAATRATLPRRRAGQRQ